MVVIQHLGHSFIVQFYNMPLQIVAKWVLHYKVGRTRIFPNILLSQNISINHIKKNHENKRVYFKNGKS